MELSLSLSLSGVGAFIDCLVLLYFYYRLTKSVSKDNKFFYYFENFTLFFGIFYLLFSVPLLLFSSNSSLIGWAYLIGHVFAYISFGYLAKITFLIAKPSFKSDNIFKLYLLIGAVITIVNIILFNNPTVSEGIASWDQNIIVGALIAIFGLTVFLPAAGLFIRESIKQPKNRKRYALIGVSFLLIIAGGPVHDLAKTAPVLFIADIITTLGFLLMFWGVMSGVKARKK